MANPSDNLPGNAEPAADPAAAPEPLPDDVVQEAGTEPAAPPRRGFKPYVVILLEDIGGMVENFGFNDASGALLVWAALQREAVRADAHDFTCPLSRLVVATGATRKTIVHRIRLLEKAAFLTVKRSRREGSRESEPNVYHLLRGRYFVAETGGGSPREQRGSPREQRGSFESGELARLKSTDRNYSQHGDTKTHAERVITGEPGTRPSAAAGVDAATGAVPIPVEETKNQTPAANPIRWE